MLSIAGSTPRPARIRNHCSLSASRGDFAPPAAASAVGSTTRNRLNRLLLMAELLTFLARRLDRDLGARFDICVVDHSVQLPVGADTAPDVHVFAFFHVRAAAHVADPVAALLDSEIAAHE